MNWLIVLLAAYLVGSISPSFFLGRILLRKDMSKEGSGNLGAKNSLEVGGSLFGVAVFLIDVFKGAGMMLWVRAAYADPQLLYWGMLGVILGHNYSLYLKFRGGKGLAAFVGMWAIVNPVLLLSMGVLAAFWALLTRHSGVAAILAALPFPFIFGLITKDWGAFPLALVLTLIVLAKHRPEEYRATASFFGLRREK